jgi:hypothetical protein
MAPCFGGSGALTSGAGVAAGASPESAASTRRAMVRNYIFNRKAASSALTG